MTALEPARRKHIHDAYASLPHDGFKTTRCTSYVNRNHRSISHFLDTASSREITILEGLLFSGLV